MRRRHLVTALTAVAALATVAQAAAEPPKTPDPPTPKPSKDGEQAAKPMVAVQVQDVYRLPTEASHVVVLRSQEEPVRLLPIWIGEAEAYAISLRLSRQHPPRPMTHDLLEDIVGRLNATVVKIQVEELKNSVFLGRIFLRRGDETFELDARPSDSIALALGAGAPIFVSAEVMESAGHTQAELGSPGPGETKRNSALPILERGAGKLEGIRL